MSYQERNRVRTACIQQAEYLDKRSEKMQWWADYLEAYNDGYVSTYQYASRLKQTS